VFAKKLAAWAMVVLMLLCAAQAESALPPVEVLLYGVDMPSMGQLLSKFPKEVEFMEDGGFEVSFEGITEEDYGRYGEQLAKEGCKVTEYTVDDSRLTATIEKSGRSFTFFYDAVEQTATMTFPKGTHDLWLDRVQEKYEEGLSLIEAGSYEEAYQALAGIPGYRDVDQIIESNEELKAAAMAAAEARAAKIAQFTTVGNIVPFGHYEQDGDTANGAEDIEWIVLDAREDSVLLLSRYCLDAKPYNDALVDITWEQSSLRAWLNADFLMAAFDVHEQAAIRTTLVDNSVNQGNSDLLTDGGEDTEDKLYLLSYAEAGFYFAEAESRKCGPTEYAIQRGAWTSLEFNADGRQTGWWWLRSPGDRQSDAACIGRDGMRDIDSVDGASGGVRPVLWLDLTSELF